MLLFAKELHMILTIYRFFWWKQLLRSDLLRQPTLAATLFSVSDTEVWIGFDALQIYGSMMSHLMQLNFGEGGVVSSEKERWGEGKKASALGWKMDMFEEK